MFFLGLISSDDALCHAISEQLKQAAGDWQQTRFCSLADALSAWDERLPPMIFWDTNEASFSSESCEFFSARIGQEASPPVTLLLGEKPDTFNEAYVTERFTRPLRLGFFLTRLHYYQRLLQQTSNVKHALGPWVFMPREKTLSNATTQENLKLTDKESELLDCLCASSTPVPREELLASIWGYDASIDTHTLETHIYRLRRKLMDAAAGVDDVFLTERSAYGINPVWRKG